MIVMLDKDSGSFQIINDRQTQSEDHNQNGFPTVSVAILTIMISLSFWLLFLFPQHWISPLFSNLLRFKGFSESSFFIGLGQNERFVFFFRMLSSLSSIVIGIVLIWLNRKQFIFRLGSAESKFNYFKGLKLKFLILNTILSITVLVLFPGDFSQTSYVSFFNFLITQIIFFSITGPIIEELTYRISLYSLLRKLFSDRSAVFLSSLVFSATHFRYGLPFCIIVFLFGVVWASSYEKTGDPIVPIFLHSSTNLISSLAFFILKTRV